MLLVICSLLGYGPERLEFGLEFGYWVMLDADVKATCLRQD